MHGGMLSHEPLSPLDSDAGQPALSNSMRCAMFGLPPGFAAFLFPPMPEPSASEACSYESTDGSREPSERSTFTDPTAPRLVHHAPLRDVRRQGWPDLKIAPYEARRQFSDLGNQAFEDFLQRRGLKGHSAANGRLVWWGDIKTMPLTQIPFDWPRQVGRRQIIGTSNKRKVHWHYAVNAQVRSGPVQHLRVSSRLLFSENGMDLINDARRMHQLRRSFAKGWMNG